MKIAVCVKHVPDTEARIRVAEDGRSIEEKDLNCVPNPFDEYAMEEALRIRERAGGGEVVLLCFGAPEAAKSLRQGLAMGADRAVLVRRTGPDPGPRPTAAVLAAAVRKVGADLVFCGKKGVGGDHGQVPALLAEALDWPQATSISKLELEPPLFRAEREIEGATECLEGSLPAVLSAEKGLNEPRYPSLKGIMAAKKKEIEDWTPDSLGLPAADLSEEAGGIVLTRLEPPPGRQPVKMIPGDPAESARELVRILHEVEKLL